MHLLQELPLTRRVLQTQAPRGEQLAAGLLAKPSAEADISKGTGGGKPLPSPPHGRTTADCPAARQGPAPGAQCPLEPQPRAEQSLTLVALLPTLKGSQRKLPEKQICF